MRSRPLQRGMSLIEVMVALVLSLILTLGVIEIFVQSRSTYRFQEALSGVQENGRFVLEQMARNIRQPGDFGCVRGGDLEYNNNVEDGNGNPWTEWNQGRELRGFEYVSGSWSPQDPGVPAATHSSAIRVKVPAGGRMRVTADPGGANIKVGDGSDLAKCEVVMVSNCRTADIFVIVNKPGSDTLTHSSSQQCGGTNSASNVSNTLSNDDYTGGTIVRQHDLVFFIQDDDGDGVPELWQRLIDGSATPTDSQMVEGVERLQLRYGEDADGDGAADSYVLASSVGNWPDVVAVRLSALIVSTNDNVTDQPQAYTFAGNTVSNPGDHRLRQVFTKTIALRNRLQ